MLTLLVARLSGDSLQEFDVGDLEYLARIANGELTSGVLKTFTSVDATADTTTLLATVPGGKDWYLIDWNMLKSGSSNGGFQFEYPTGTDIETIETGSSGQLYIHQGVSKGTKLVANDTVSFTKTGTIASTTINMQILEVDTGVSPNLQAQSITVDADITGEATDLGFLQERILSGNTFEVSGDIDDLNGTIEFIVPNGKTAFLLEAKIVISNHQGLASMTAATTQNTISQSRVRAALKINNVIKDTTDIGVAANMATNGNHSVSSGGGGHGISGDGRFNVKTLSLVGDGVKKIEIENILANGFAFATMSGYLADT